MCDAVFERLTVSYLVRGGTIVRWGLKPEFMDPRPHTFQLQVGQSANPDADDWIDVDAPVVDQFVAVDGEQRIYGKMRWQYYRVKLTTDAGVYFSEPTGLMGTLGRRDWRIAREAVRQELVRMKMAAGQLGYLLKRRVTGANCPHCLDQQTKEVRNPSCPYCYGTGKLCGFFYPISCVWADISPKAVHLNIDPSRGTAADIGVRARMLNVWLLSEEDVWIQRSNDDRYYVHSVSNIAEIQGVPIVADVEMRPAPATDVVYTIPIPQQIANIGG